MTAAATLTDVTVHFREHTALDGVTASIERDGITGLLGRNGAGTTTPLQLLTGHRVPTRGQVRVLGADPYETTTSCGACASSGRGSVTPTTSGCAMHSRRRPRCSPGGTRAWRARWSTGSACRPDVRSRSCPAAWCRPSASPSGWPRGPR